jgi:drug/metabolite transporter (DMT)-like permease
VTSRKDHLDLLAMAVMVGLCAVWGLNQVMAKITNAGISPILQAGLRSAVATPLLMGWAAWRRIPLFERDGSLWPGLVAGIGFAVEFALLFQALAFTSASRVVVLFYTTPFIVAVGVHFTVPGERLNRWQALGLAAAFLGIVSAFAENLGSPGLDHWIGDLLALGAALMWGGTTVLVRASRLARLSATKTLFYQLAVSAILLPPASWLLGEPGIMQPTLLHWTLFGLQAVGVAFASYLAWFWLITRYPATKLSAFSFLTPLFGMALGALLLNERISAYLMLAMMLVGGGIWLVNRKG